MAALQSPFAEHVSPQEYLARERAAEFKSEYINGQIYAMAGASPAHNFINGNVFASLHAQLRGKKCRPFTQDLRVHIPQTALYTYPDVVVACPPLEFEDEQEDTLLNPVLIVEVLSPSTESYDRGDKWAHYQRLPSLRDYVLVSQDRARIEQFTRQPDGRWSLQIVESPGGAAQLSHIGCTLRLSDVYEAVELRAPSPRAPRPAAS